MNDQKNSRVAPSKLTVLQVGPLPPQIGGMETFLGDLTRSSLRSKVQLILLNNAKLKLQKGGKYAIQTGYRGAFHRSLKITLASYAYSFKFFLQFIGLLSTRHIDVVHIHTASYTSFWEKCALVAVAKGFRKAVVMHVHGALFRDFYQHSRASLQRLIRRTLERCDAVVVWSPSWQRFFSSILTSDRIYVVENGINLAPFQERLSHPAGVRFLHIGEVSSRKGIYDLVDAVKRLKDESPPFHVDIVGPGEIEEVTRLIQTHNLQQFITLHGPKRGVEKYPFFQQASVFVLASYAEGLPIAILEALAAGLVVISTEVGGIPDVIRPDDNGFLIEPGDTTALAQAMQRILQNKQLQQTIAHNNRKLAFETYNIERCAEKVFHIYQSIFKQKLDNQLKNRG